jgi:hypothetical protein
LTSKISATSPLPRMVEPEMPRFAAFLAGFRLDRYGAGGQHGGSGESCENLFHVLTPLMAATFAGNR